MKALISYYNRPSHTILTKLDEMGISLMGIAEIGGLPVWGGMYNEHNPPQEVVEEDDLLGTLITIHKTPLESSTHTRSHKKYVPWLNGPRSSLVQ